MLKYPGVVLLAVAATLCFSLSPLLIKSGVATLSPQLGAGVAITMAAFSHLIFALTRGYLRPGLNRDARGVMFMSLAGASNVVAVNFYYLAIADKGISIAMPLTFTFPLFAVILARVFMQKLERVTFRVALGAALVVAGMAVITLP